jgi:transcriptional regulator with XRE-family HTH domain
VKNPRTQAWLTKPDGLATRMKTARGSLSVRQLADKMRWPVSKTSRIENGQQIPTSAEVDAWASATGTAEDKRQQWQDLLDEVLSMRSTFQRRLKVSQAEVQSTFDELEASSTFVRQLQPAVVPALLQTPAYSRELFIQVQEIYDASRDIDQAVAARRKRQEHLDNPSKRFEFIVGEAALRCAPGKVDVMSAQLDRLISATDMLNVRLGVVPQLKALKTMLGPSSFVIYDNEAAIMEGWVENRDYAGEHVGFLHSMMDRFWQDAVEGEEARSLILAAKTAFSRLS